MASRYSIIEKKIDFKQTIIDFQEKTILTSLNVFIIMCWIVKTVDHSWTVQSMKTVQNAEPHVDTDVLHVV